MRAQAWKDATIKPIAAKDVTAQTFVTKNELAKLHRENTTLQKYVNQKDAVKKGTTKQSMKSVGVSYTGYEAEIMD